MRNYTCTFQYRDDEEGGGDLTANPVISRHHKSLVFDEIWCRGGGGDEDGADVHSLHLKSLIDQYLEPSSSPLPISSFCNSPFPLSNYTFNHHSSHEDHKSLIHELQATFQTMGEQYGELRKELMRAIRKGSTHMHSCAHAPYPSYKLVHELVLEHLRKLGFNAGICKSQRDSQKNPPRCYFPAEEYEYMDVILPKKGAQSHAIERVIIDLRFRSQFEIARPSTAYVDLLKAVPVAYVGTPRVLQKILRSLSEAMRKSLESRGMPLPPWRKLSFLRSKWLSPNYSRSIFALPLANFKYIINKPSNKRENSLCITHKSPSYNNRRECSHCIMHNYSTCDGVKPSHLVDSEHKSTKRENSHSLISNYNSSSLFTRPPLPVDSKRILKSCNLTSHAPRNGSNKQTSIQSGEPVKVPWEVPPISNPPSSLTHSRRHVGALTLALRNS